LLDLMLWPFHAGDTGSNPVGDASLSMEGLTRKS
jgi:hypothetical protein